MEHQFALNVGNLLEGKNAIVTGCSSGLGAATTRTFLHAGANVFGIYYSEADKKVYRENAIKDLERFTRAYPHNFAALDIDLAHKLAPNVILKEVKSHFSDIEILCNFAGFAEFVDFDKMSREQYERVLMVNLSGHVFLTQKIAEEMKKNQLRTSSRGSIINMSSVVGPIVGEDRVLAYGITKAAMLGFTKELAIELGSYGIRANSILPGSVVTPINHRDYSDEKRRGKISERTALGRWGFPQEVANVALFLASDLSSYITGTEIIVDGGMTGTFRLTN